MYIYIIHNDNYISYKDLTKTKLIKPCLDA